MLYTESKKQKAKLTPTPPPIISTIIIIYSLCYQLIYWLFKREVAQTSTMASEMRSVRRR